MIPQSLQLEVVTPERHLVREQVTEVQVPGKNGCLGILPGHAPMLTELGIGEMAYRKGQHSIYLSVIHGYAEVLGDRVIILAEVAELAEEIDVERARTARERAEKRLSERDPDVDWQRASLALQRALLRLQVAAKGGAAAGAAEEEEHRAPA
jgi:F-type H+-transporting ATPase subunit epsilon